MGFLLVVLDGAAVVARPRLTVNCTGRGRRLHLAVSAVAAMRSGVVPTTEARASIWHTLSVDEVLAAALGTGLTGLAGAEAAQRLHIYGPNELHATDTARPRGTPSRPSSRTSSF